VIQEQQRKVEALGFTIHWAWWPSVQADWQLGHHKQVCGTHHAAQFMPLQHGELDRV